MIYYGLYGMDDRQACLARRFFKLFPASVKTARGKEWGYINGVGNLMIPPYYEDGRDFQGNGLAIVQKKGLYGLIDLMGRYVVKPKYDTINQFSEGRAAVVDHEGFRVIDERGRELTKKSYNYIGRYQQGRALASNKDAQGKYLYGFLDLKGDEVIPFQYESASDFKDGKSVVKVTDNEYRLIDLNGEVLYTYFFAFVGNLGDGLLAYQENINDKYGYIDEAGNVVISPQYTIALPFSNGRTVVNVSDSMINRYGLIDKNGFFIIKPQYNDIRLLGENRAAVGRPINDQEPYMGSKYAIATDDGRFLTDFIYYDVLDYNRGLASASDDKNTFFIDIRGKIATDLPIIRGNGTLTFDPPLIQVNVDNRLSYIDRFGNVIWRQNTIIPLNRPYYIIEKKYKPNKDYLVYYPQIEGMENEKKQSEANGKLKELSQVKEIHPDGQLDASYSGDFSVTFFKKDLLVLELDGYEYYFGAAHGMPIKIYPHVDLVSGRFYQLEDLFKRGSDYVKVLSDIIGEQIKNNEEYSYVFPDSYEGITEEQPFYVKENALYIYFDPYDIGPYAVGFPTFKIPYRGIMDILDVRGTFWRSFHDE